MGSTSFKINETEFDALGTDLNYLQVSAPIKVPIQMTHLTMRVSETLILTQDEDNSMTRIDATAGANTWIGKTATLSSKQYITLTRDELKGGLLTLLDSFVICV